MPLGGVHSQGEGAVRNDDTGTGGLPPLPPSFKEDAFDLAEGRAVFRWPDRLTPESVAELQEWLSLIVRKMARMTGAKLKPNAKLVPTDPKEAGANTHPLLAGGPSGMLAVVPVPDDI